MQVSLEQHEEVAFEPNPWHDGGAFSTLEDLERRLPGEGYGGGIRLLKVLGGAVPASTQQ